MEHPLLGDINDLNLEELQNKITELNKKRAWAVRTNAHLAYQLDMVLESFNNRYQQRLRELSDRQRGDAPDYSDRIDVS